MISIKPLCNHVIVLDTIFEDYFYAENNEKKYIFLRETPHKIASTRAALLIQICTKSFVGWGFAPDPTGGA